MKLGRYLVHGLGALSVIALAVLVTLFVTYPTDQDVIGLAVVLFFALVAAGCIVVYVLLLCGWKALAAWQDLSRRDEST